MYVWFIKQHVQLPNTLHENEKKMAYFIDEPLKLCVCSPIVEKNLFLYEQK
jgi:hypothetical protein